MKRNRQQQEVERIVDDMMAEIIEEMAHSQPMKRLVGKLLALVCPAVADLEKLEKTAAGEYVYEEYGG